MKNQKNTSNLSDFTNSACGIAPKPYLNKEKSRKKLFSKSF